MPYQRKTMDIFISPKLISLLEQFANKSEVARKLLKSKLSKEDLVDDPINYIAIAKDDPTKISYAYSEKLDKIEPEEYWSFKGRVAAKPAAAIKKFLKDVTEKDLDIFTNLYKAALAPKNFSFSIVSGSDIKKYYNGNSYAYNCNGTLYASCMKHDNCNEFFDMYVDNPEVCQMLIMLDRDNMLLGRALLWDAVDIEKQIEVKVMDRVYATNDHENLHHFRDWADDNGYIFRDKQNWFDCLRFQSFGVSKLYKLSLKINNKVYSRYPYVDTFKFWDEKNCTLSNFLPKDNGYIRTLIGNGGNTFGSNALGYDGLKHVYEHNDRLINLDYLNIRTNGETAIYSNCMELYMLREHSIYVEEIEDYIFNDEYKIHNNETSIEKRREYFRKRQEKISKEMENIKAKKTSVVGENSEQASTTFDMFNVIQSFNDTIVYGSSVRNTGRNRVSANRISPTDMEQNILAPIINTPLQSESTEGTENTHNNVFNDNILWSFDYPTPAIISVDNSNSDPNDISLVFNIY